MTRKRRSFTKEFKLERIRELENGKKAVQIGREYGILPSLISSWKKDYYENPGQAFQGNGNIYKDEAKIAELERKIGQLYIENEFLKKALKTLEVRMMEEKKKSINRRNILWSQKIEIHIIHLLSRE